MNPPQDMNPPKWPLRFLRWIVKEAYLEEIEGDMEEIFRDNLDHFSLKKARRLYALGSLKLMRPTIMKNILPTHSFIPIDMFKHNLMISWRHLLKNKGFSMLNIGGLAIGMMVAILIGLWIWDELSFNTYHKNYERIAQVMQNQTFDREIQTWNSQAKQLGTVLHENYGNHFRYVSMASWIDSHSLALEDKVLSKSGIFMEPGAPEMLSLEMLLGDREALTDPYSILLSESTAKAYFGDENPLGRVLRIDNAHDLKVTAVYEDIPANSTFSEVQFFGSWELHLKDKPDWLGWGNSWFQTFVQLKEGADIAEVSALIKDIKLNEGGEGNAKFKPEIFLHPMSKWHLYSDFKEGVNVGGRIQYVWLYGIIGVFVLLLACINFMNLSTARSEKRAREVGVRKAMGSNRAQLIGQFFSESLLIALFAFLLSLLGAYLLLPSFNEVAAKEMNMLWSNLQFWLLGMGFVIFTGLIAGSYPALYLSSFQAVKVLKGTFQAGRYATIPRKALVVVQFTVSVSLIIGTMIVFQQIQFAKNRPIGYHHNRLLIVPINKGEIRRHYTTLKNDLMQTGVVESVAKAESRITNTRVTNSGLDWQGKDPNMQDEFVSLRVSHDFGKTVGWEIVQGRDFSREYATDSMGFIINEVAVDYMGFEDPIGQRVVWGDDETYTIIGVVKNMITQSPYVPTRQMFFFIDYRRSHIAHIKLQASAIPSEAIAKIEEVFHQHDPLNPFEYYFVDQQYAKKFGDEERIGKLAAFFAVLAIFISCLGLFGMASFVAEQRAKEISIRKVLGASITDLWHLLSKEFVMLVSLSCLIAIPIAWYFLAGWLDNYAYHTSISGWIFTAAAMGALLITLLTVSYHALKVAKANPVDSLRSE